jgi:hypothetical protein
LDSPLSDPTLLDHINPLVTLVSITQSPPIRG